MNNNKFVHVYNNASKGVPDSRFRHLCFVNDQLCVSRWNDKHKLVQMTYAKAVDRYPDELTDFIHGMFSESESPKTK